MPRAVADRPDPRVEHTYRDKLGRAIADWPADRSLLISAGAVVFYHQLGARPPVRVATTAHLSVGERSLEVVLRDPIQDPLQFVMIVGLSDDYLGPGEYRGGSDDIAVGLGVLGPDDRPVTWTASPRTASHLTTYGSATQTTAATFTATGLLTGPLLGPPDGQDPACDVVFAWFDVEA